MSYGANASRCKSVTLSDVGTPAVDVRKLAIHVRLRVRAEYDHTVYAEASRLRYQTLENGTEAGSVTYVGNLRVEVHHRSVSLCGETRNGPRSGWPSTVIYHAGNTRRLVPVAVKV